MREVRCGEMEWGCMVRWSEGGGVVRWSGDVW